MPVPFNILKYMKGKGSVVKASAVLVRKCIIIWGRIRFIFHAEFIGVYGGDIPWRQVHHTGPHDGTHAFHIGMHSLERQQNSENSPFLLHPYRMRKNRYLLC